MSRTSVSAIAVTLTLLLAAACRSDRSAWLRRLAQPSVARLEGHWTVELATGSSAGARQAQGTIALVLNRERNRTSAFSDAPELFGTYDVPFNSLGNGLAPVSGPPDVLAFVVGDSVFLRLAPQADISVVLAGAWQGDSITGRWYTSDRAGPNALGRFLLRTHR